MRKLIDIIFKLFRRPSKPAMTAEESPPKPDFLATPADDKPKTKGFGFSLFKRKESNKADKPAKKEKPKKEKAPRKSLFSMFQRKGAAKAIQTAWRAEAILFRRKPGCVLPKSWHPWNA